MTKSVKVVLGIATMWPLIYLFIFMGLWFYIVLSMTSHQKGADGIPPWMIAIFILHGITMLWIFTLLVIYIYDVFTNDKVGKDKKTLWAVVLFLGNMIAMPIYWYLYIWREPPITPASENA